MAFFHFIFNKNITVDLSNSPITISLAAGLDAENNSESHTDDEQEDEA